MLVCFLACATAYAFFQVPYVSMPAEMTASYDERTRLMTWRVAILAFTIMLAGATAPVIRDAVGGRAGYRVMGVAMARGHRGRRRSARTAAPATRRSARSSPGRASLRDQLRIVAGARDFRLLLITFVVQALATGCMLAGVDYLASDVLDRTGATTILFVCFVGPALLLTPAWSAIGARIGKKQGYLASSVILAAGALLAVLRPIGAVRLVVAAVALVGVGYAGCQVFPLAMLPDAAAVDARRTGSSPGRRLHRRLDRGRDARPRARPGAVRAGARARRLPLEHRRRRRPARLARSPRSRSASRCCRRRSCCSACLAGPLLALPTSTAQDET